METETTASLVDWTYGKHAAPEHATRLALAAAAYRTMARAAGCPIPTDQPGRHRTVAE